MEKKEKVEEKSEYQLVQVPTGQALAIQTPEGQVITTEEALVEILNILKEIKSSVA